MLQWLWVYDVDVLYLEDGNVYRLLLKNKTATRFFSKNLFLVIICSVKQLTPVVSIYKENKIDMPKKKYRKSRAMEGVEEGSSKLEVQETGQEKETQPPTSPQYEDVTQESDLESVASFSASQSKRKRKFSWTLEQEEEFQPNPSVFIGTKLYCCVTPLPLCVRN